MMDGVLWYSYCPLEINYGNWSFCISWAIYICICVICICICIYVYVYVYVYVYFLGFECENGVQFHWLFRPAKKLSTRKSHIDHPVQTRQERARLPTEWAPRWRMSASTLIIPTVSWADPWMFGHHIMARYGKAGKDIKRYKKWQFKGNDMVDDSFHPSSLIIIDHHWSSLSHNVYMWPVWCEPCSDFDWSWVRCWDYSTQLPDSRCVGML